MKICVFSDVHGNIHYMNSFLRAVEPYGVDQFFFLGDALGYLPDGAAVLARLREIQAFCVKGNHEALLLGMLPEDAEKEAVYHLNEQKAALSEEDLRYIRTWPITFAQELNGRHILFLHGTVADPLSGYGYESSNIAEFDQAELDLIFIGQTHRPWQKQNDHTRIINVGSVGLPRDIGNQPSFAIFDTIAGTTEIQRIQVDPSPILTRPIGIHPSVLECLKRE